MPLPLSKWTSGMWNPWIQSWQASYSSITTALSSACARCQFLNDGLWLCGPSMCAHIPMSSSCTVCVCMIGSSNAYGSFRQPSSADRRHEHHGVLKSEDD